MSNEVLQAARTLIETKHYEEARTLLKTIDHPTATKWLAKLDEIAPAPKSQPQKSNKGLFLTLGLVGIFVILLAIFVVILTNRNTDVPAAATINAVVSAPTLPVQSTSIPVALQNTAVPSTNNSGLRTSPIPLGTGQTFPGLGTLTILESQWMPQQTGMAIIRLSFTCERPTNQLCETDSSTFFLDAVGGSGLVYGHEFDRTIPDPTFGGFDHSEVYGGASIDGYAGFLITNPEANLTLRVFERSSQGEVFFNITADPSASMSIPTVPTPIGVQTVVASDAGLGSRENAISVGTGFQIPAYGILTVTEVQWESGQTGLAIVKMALICQLSPNQSCETSDFLIDVVGESGTIYERSFDSSNIPNPRWGEEIYGGGSIEGHAAFLITASENALSLRVRGRPVRNNLNVDELFYQMTGSGISASAVSSSPGESAAPSETPALAARVGELMDADAAVMSDPALVQILEQAKTDYQIVCVAYFDEQQGEGEYQLDFTDICTALTEEQFLEWGAIPAFVDCQQQFNLQDHFSEYKSCVQRNGVRVSLDIE